MKYKLSRFNYHTRNLQGDLLVYNTYLGISSLLKIPCPQADYYERFLNGTADLEQLSEIQLEAFKTRGIVVPEEENELEKLKLIRYNVVHSRILSITILTTGQCNFRCVYCYESFIDGEMSLQNQANIIDFVQKNIQYYSALEVGWFGGEPLCGMNVIKNLSEAFMDICKKNGKPYIAHITTNGYLLTLPVLQQLKKWNVLRYQITIDGLEETHDRQKPLAGGGKTFQRVIENLENIRDHEKSKMLTFIIRTNISKEIKETFKEYQRFYGKKFGADSRFRYLFRPVMDLGGERIHGFVESLVESLNFFESLFVDISDPRNGRLPITPIGLDPGSGVCYASKMGNFVFDAKGQILKCTCRLDDCPENVIGHFFEEGTWKIEPSKYAAWLNETHPCEKSCFFAPVCLGESCSARRVVRGSIESACPHERSDLRGVMLMLDAHNQLFSVAEELMDL